LCTTARAFLREAFRERMAVRDARRVLTVQVPVRQARPTRATSPLAAARTLLCAVTALAGGWFNGGCGGGHRIFVNRGAQKAQVIVKNGSD
jgi:hypothetical protein